MIIRKTLAVFALMCLGFHAFAEDADELRALELQLKILQTTESLNDLLGQVRDSVRPSDAMQIITGVPHSGWAITRANELMQALAKSVESASPALKRLEEIGEATNVVKRIAAFSKAVLDMERLANSQGESWGADAVNGLADAIEGISKVIPGPSPVKLYISRLTGAIRSSADNIATAEARRNETNWAIEEADKAIGGWNDLEAELDSEQQEDPAIQELRDEIRKLREAMDEKEYAKVYAAREKCYGDAGITQKDFFRTGLRRDEVRFAIARLESSMDRLPITAYLEREIRIVTDNLLNEKRKIDKPGFSNNITRGRIERLTLDLDILVTELNSLRSMDDKLRSAIVAARAKFDQLDTVIRKIEDCVKKELEDVEFPDGYLEENFQQYTALVVGEGDPSSINVDTGAHYASGPPTGDEWRCLAEPREMTPGEAMDFDWTISHSLLPGQEVVREFSMPRGTDVRADLDNVIGIGASALLEKQVINANGEYIYAYREHTLDWAGSAEQKYRVTVTDTRTVEPDDQVDPITFNLRITGKDRGDMGLHQDAGNTVDHAVLIPIGVSFEGNLDIADYQDLYLVPYVDPFTRIRVTVDETERPSSGKNVMVYVSSQICDGDGNVQSYLGVESGTVTSVRPGESGFVDYITNSAGHYLILVRRGYGAPHSYRIKVEILDKETITHDGRIIGYLGRREPGWYALSPGTFRNMADFGDRQSAVDWLIDLAR